MKKVSFWRFATSLCAIALACFLLLFNASSNRHNTGSKNKGALVTLNVEALRASATVYVCDATNTSSCTITTPEGVGKGTGNGIIYQN